MTTPLTFGINQFNDQNGAPYAGGSLSFYQANTLNPKTPFQDTAGQTPTTNPLILDGAGRATVYGQGGYRVILKDKNGNKIWDKLALATVPLDDSGNLTIPNTVTSNNVVTKNITASGDMNLTGRLTTGALLVSSTSTDSGNFVRLENTSSNGINIKLLGNGSTTPAKYLRVINGVLELINNAYTEAVFRISDTGRTYSKSGFQVNNQVASTTSDLSQHIDLYGGTYGANITAARLNLVAPSNSSVMTVIGGTDVMQVTNGAVNISGSINVNTSVITPNVVATNVYASNAMFVTGGGAQGAWYGTASNVVQQYQDNWYWLFDRATGDYTWHSAYSGDGRQLAIQSDGNNVNYRGPFTGNGAYGTISDERVKEDITPSTYGLKEILQLNPRKFRRVLHHHHEIGFVAQEVNQVIPEAISTSSVTVPGLEDAMVLHSEVIVAALVKATKELHGQIKDLKQHLVNLLEINKAVRDEMIDRMNQSTPPVTTPVINQTTTPVTLKPYTNTTQK